MPFGGVPNEKTKWMSSNSRDYICFGGDVRRSFYDQQRRDFNHTKFLNTRDNLTEVTDELTPMQGSHVDYSEPDSVMIGSYQNTVKLLQDIHSSSKRQVLTIVCDI